MIWLISKLIEVAGDLYLGGFIKTMLFFQKNTLFFLKK